MADCPVCETTTLRHATLSGNLPVYSCYKCGGILLSLVVYRHWRESYTLQSLPPESPTDISPGKTNDTSSVLTCPRCRSVMVKYRIAAGPRNHLDFCAHCEDVWLDGREWKLVEALAASGELIKIFTQPWQRHIRAGISESMQSERLKIQPGPDYEKFTEFREWLDTHLQRDELISLLIRGK